MTLRVFLKGVTIISHYEVFDSYENFIHCKSYDDYGDYKIDYIEALESCQCGEIHIYLEELK